MESESENDTAEHDTPGMMSRRSFLGGMFGLGAMAALGGNTEAASKKEGVITIPDVGDVKLSDKVIPDGHFTWNEVTKGGARVPASKTIHDRILVQAQYMEQVRAQLGNKPITIVSWYRSPEANKAVGGASKSRHMVGDACDIQVGGMKPSEVQDALDKWHGAKGGLGRYNTFTHIDIRGSYARWDG